MGNRIRHDVHDGLAAQVRTTINHNLATSSSPVSIDLKRGTDTDLGMALYGFRRTGNRLRHDCCRCYALYTSNRRCVDSPRRWQRRCCNDGYDHYQFDLFYCLAVLDFLAYWNRDRTVEIDWYGLQAVGLCGVADRCGTITTGSPSECQLGNDQQIEVKHRGDDRRACGGVPRCDRNGQSRRRYSRHFSKGFISRSDRFGECSLCGVLVGNEDRRRHEDGTTRSNRRWIFRQPKNTRDWLVDRNQSWIQYDSYFDVPRDAIGHRHRSCRSDS